MAYMIEKHRQN